jgi:hypothetical protein
MSINNTSNFNKFDDEEYNDLYHDKFSYDDEFNTEDDAGFGWRRLKHSRESNAGRFTRTWMPNFDYLDRQSRYVQHMNYGSDGLAGMKNELSFIELHKLNELRKTVVNFCSIILQGKKVNVTYAGSQSLTDGNSIIISADIVKNFDTVVGLAMHESSHIRWSNFNLIKDLFTQLEDLAKEYITKIQKEHPTVIKNKELFEKYSNALTKEISEFGRGVQNWIEDRRIDNLALENFPGYLGYYSAFYEQCFRGIPHQEYIDKYNRTGDIFQDYMAYILLSMCPNFKLNALPNLARIMKLLDANVLSSMKQEKNVDTSLQIMRIILEEYMLQLGGGSDPNDEQKMEKHMKDACEGAEQKFGNPSAEGENGAPRTFQLSDDPSGTGGSGEPINFRPGIDKLVDKDGKEIDVNKMVGEELKKAQKLIEDMQDLVNDSEKLPNDKGLAKDGKVSKKDKINKDKQTSSTNELYPREHLTVSDVERLSTWIKSQADIFTSDNFDCALLPLIKIANLNDKNHPIHDILSIASSVNVAGTPEKILEAYNFGRSLRPKLKFINMEGKVRITRKLEGKLDKRKLFEFFGGSQRLFYTEKESKGEEFHFHFAIDASGSMSGAKWLSARCVLMTIVSALHGIPGISISADMRTNISGRRSWGSSMPVTAIIYDSRVSKPLELLEMLQRMHGTGGDNADGVSIDATRKFLSSVTKKPNKIFINISDGRPSHSSQGKSYSGNEAIKHTGQAVQRLRKNGWAATGFYIDERNAYDGGYLDEFKKQYGEKSKIISYTDTMEIARTINAMIADSAAGNGISSNIF